MNRQVSHFLTLGILLVSISRVVSGQSDSSCLPSVCVREATELPVASFLTPSALGISRHREAMSKPTAEAYRTRNDDRQSGTFPKRTLIGAALGATLGFGLLIVTQDGTSLLPSLHYAAIPIVFTGLGAAFGYAFERKVEQGHQ